jgi:hypothetical protein
VSLMIALSPLLIAAEMAVVVLLDCNLRDRSCPFGGVAAARDPTATFPQILLWRQSRSRIEVSRGS